VKHQQRIKKNEMTYTTENFSSGNGKMMYGKFANYADQVGVMQAVWIAKHFGVSLNKVKAYVRLYTGFGLDKN
jgi:hypothetical protein